MAYYIVISRIRSSLHSWSSHMWCRMSDSWSWFLGYCPIIRLSSWSNDPILIISVQYVLLSPRIVSSLFA